MQAKQLLYEMLNTPVRALLRSPLHGVASRNLCLLRYRGRRSGREYTTPLSYVREGGTVLLLSSHNTAWWQNFLPDRTGDVAEVEVVVRGEALRGTAETIVGGEGDAAADARLAEGVRRFLTALPRDAVVYGIGLDDDRKPRERDIERKLDHVVLVEITLGA